MKRNYRELKKGAVGIPYSQSKYVQVQRARITLWSKRTMTALFGKRSPLATVVGKAGWQVIDAAAPVISADHIERSYEFTSPAEREHVMATGATARRRWKMAAG